MNLLRILPEKIRNKYSALMLKAEIKNPEDYFSKAVVISLIAAVVAAVVLYFFKLNVFLVFIIAFIFIHLVFYFSILLKVSAKIKKIEMLFPDMIQLMSSNLRAGMTVDRAFLLSARPEFYPLDKEIMDAGKQIATGKDITFALKEMARRIGSEKIAKTINLIISGLRAGGNISTLLEQTASNMREKEFVEKRAASNILMYVIFIFVAVAIGAPLLFGLSSILVEVIVSLVKIVPVDTTGQIPFAFSAIELPENFIIYFSLIFLALTNLISSLVMGLVNKGEAKPGLKYYIPLLILSYAIFFIVRIVLSGFIKGSFNLAG